ncbi:MAG: DNA repair protein RecO [Treponema sp.]|nr:DNA repair protein RecO [Treponema sp.]
MPERNKSTQAIILSVKEQGENNRSACIVSPDRGVFYATLYGGAKSKMRSLVQPFNKGIIYLYEDEAKHFVKISDFDVKKCHLSLHTDIYKMMAANLASEILIKTKCAGEYESSFTLFAAFLEGIEHTQGFDSRTGTIRFLWRYLKILGQQPDVNTCTSCTAPISTQNALGGSFIRHINGFVCKDCAPSYRESQTFSKEQAPFLSSTSLFYLNAVNTLRPSTVRGMELSKENESELKTFLFMLIEQAIGSRLNSLETGSGIL